MEGEAKAEIRFCSLTDRENPEVVLQILKELYGSSSSFVGLQKQFFERKQKDNESLKEFSHSLWALIGDIQCSYPNKLIDPDILVRDQFVEHVRDVALRRELKSIVRQNSSISFLALRQEAIKWAEEGERPFGQARVGLYHQGADFNVEGACNSMGTGKGFDLSALQEQLHKQQLQINSILQSLAKIQSVLDQSASRPLNSNYQFTAEGLPICLRCCKPGHILRQCRQGPRPQATSPSVETNANPAATGPSGMGDGGRTSINNVISSMQNSPPLIDKCPIVDVVMGGVEVKCLLDTGSMVTTITESFFKEAFKPLMAPRLQSCGWLVLKAANGLDIPYVGYLELDVQVLGRNIPGRGVLVVKDPLGASQQEAVPGLLGMNVIGECY